MRKQTRIFVHAKDAVTKGIKAFMISANDTDVAIAVSAMSSLQDLGLQQLWIVYGQGQNRRWIPIHEIFSTLGPEKITNVLPCIHWM